MSTTDYKFLDLKSVKGKNKMSEIDLNNKK